MPEPNFSATVSLLHNNLVSSSGGWLTTVHNSVNFGSGKLMLHSLASGQSKDGPEVTQATSVRYLDLMHGPVLCVSSTNGTQIYNEDASALLFFAPNNDSSATTDLLKCHQAACVVPALQHIVIGTSKGSLVVVHSAAADKFDALPESVPATAATEISDICYSEAAQAIISAHSNGELRAWAPVANGPYGGGVAEAGNGQAPVRIVALGSRLLVAYGPGTVCLYDALTRELQAELTAHARWITGVAVREELGQVATVSEDTVLNVWQVDPSSGRVALLHSSVVTDKLLTGVALHGELAAVTAYDSESIFKVAL
mmetsp:Transcript_69994/g.226418  ORF Transcript_69994/g.226418 Transcript_69994/m.226418 type:complete len:313 (-) Transcript_69994:99-1037(-)